jgi:hypothetical protein
MDLHVSNSVARSTCRNYLLANLCLSLQTAEMLHQEQAHEAQDKVDESVLDLGVVQGNPLAALTPFRT